MKYLKTFEDRQETSVGVLSSNLKPGERYLTDEEIEDDYNEWTIKEDEFSWYYSQGKDKAPMSGTIILNRPYDESCDECETEKVENFIKSKTMCSLLLLK